MMFKESLMFSAIFTYKMRCVITCSCFPKSNLNCLKFNNGKILRAHPSSTKTRFITITPHMIHKGFFRTLPSIRNSSSQKLICCPQITQLIMGATLSLLVPTVTYMSSKVFIWAIICSTKLINRSHSRIGARVFSKMLHDEIVFRLHLIPILFSFGLPYQPF